MVLHFLCHNVPRFTSQFLVGHVPMAVARALAPSDQRWGGRPHLLLERYGEPHLLRMVVWSLVNHCGTTIREHPNDQTSNTSGVNDQIDGKFK